LQDIAGRERIESITRIYYKDAVGCIVVFDVTRGSTFEAVEKWKNDLDSKVRLPNGKHIPCILLANKVLNELQISIRKYVRIFFYLNIIVRSS
jgi:Ras-related protein Rab-32